MCDGHSDVLVDIGEKIIDVDGCIAPLVKILNDGGYRTLASCCGHGKRPGTVPLFDPDGNERWLILTRDRAEGERLIEWPDVYCVERDGRRAVTSRPTGVSGDGTPTVDLVCEIHAGQTDDG